MKKTLLTEDLSVAARSIQEGGVVIFPTETVYGLGAASANFDAIQRIYSIKGRPQDNPLIVHVDSLVALDQAAEISSKLLDQLEPLLLSRSLTLILPKKNKALFSCGLDTIAIRIPTLPFARSFIHEAGTPISAPSANRSGRPSITFWEEAWAEFQGEVDVVLKGPPSEIGLESTVIDLSSKPYHYLRPGDVSFEELQPLFDQLILPETMAAKIRSPGIKYRHYAPKAKLFLVESLKGVKGESFAQIGFSLFDKTALDINVKSNEEYAQKLFWFLLSCDKMDLQAIYCEYPKKGRLYEALLNRLIKASGCEGISSC